MSQSEVCPQYPPADAVEMKFCFLMRLSYVNLTAYESWERTREIKVLTMAAM